MNPALPLLRRTSINRRMLFGAGGLLLIFMLATAAALNQAFTRSAETTRTERLQALVYLILSATEVDDAGMIHMPKQLAEPRFMVPGSGLIATIYNEKGIPLWQSPSALGAGINRVALVKPGQKMEADFSPSLHKVGTRYHAFSQGVAWPVAEIKIPLTLTVLEDPRPLAAALQQYRRTLWQWLGGLAVILLLAQTLLLRWGLRPLRGVTRELKAIEMGESHALAGVYPDELAGLARNLNAVLAHERQQQTRYRHALDDLAHSLKTPLAVLAGADPHAEDFAQLVSEHCTRMTHIVSRQLQRAALAGRSAFVAPLPLAPLITRLIGTMQKVHAERALDWQLSGDLETTARIDPADALELLGNVLDNAGKWARHRVQVHLQLTPSHAAIQITDDGPGFGDAQRATLRGVRLDETVPGQGLGLALVVELVHAYQGEIHLKRDAILGGAAIAITLPHRMPLA